MAGKNYWDTVSKFLILGFLVWFGLLPAAQAQTVGYEIPAGVVSYSNSGAVSAEETVEDDESVSEVGGVYSDHGLILFENTAAGSISASVLMGDAAGDVSEAYIGGTRGVQFGNYWGEDVVYGNFSNTGEISASATAGSAIGDSSQVYVVGTRGVQFINDLEGSFTNTGTISTSLTAGSASGENSAMEITDIYGVYLAAGTGLLFATPYGVIENDGTVEGEFANLTVGYTNPDITVNWADSAEKGENAAVVFGFEPKNNVGARSVNVGSALLSQRLNLFSNVLYSPGSSSELTADVNKKSVLYAQAGSSDADPDVPLAYRYENGMYFLPYYSNLSDSGIGADADTYGFFLGYERVLGDDFIAGVFGGHSRSDLDYTGVFNGNTEDQDTYSLGINVVYDQPRWFGDFFANYNWISHEYAGRTGANFELPETADYDSTAFVSQIRTGYKHPLGYDAGLYPYVGLRSTYWSTDGYTTSVAPANWRMNYGSFSETWFKGILGLSADKKWQGTDYDVYGGLFKFKYKF